MQEKEDDGTGREVLVVVCHDGVGKGDTKQSGRGRATTDSILLSGIREEVDTMIHES